MTRAQEKIYKKLAPMHVTKIVRFEGSIVLESFWYKKKLARNRAAFYSVQVSGTSFRYKVLSSLLDVKVLRNDVNKAMPLTLKAKVKIKVNILTHMSSYSPSSSCPLVRNRWAEYNLAA